MSKLNEPKAIALLDEGRAHLKTGDPAKAEKCFQAAAAISDVPAARNNWALCRYLAGAHAEALRILEPVLANRDPVPFTRALASLCLTGLGDKQRAKLALDAAIRDLDAGLAAAQWRGAQPDQAWAEYTITIKRAAGALGLDRLVLDLHGRWPGRDLPEGAFAAGVAAFHLGRYAQAAKYWERITAPNWGRPMQAYVAAANLVESGQVPPFRLEYEPDDKPDPNVPPGIMAARGAVRVQMLAYLFHGDAKDKGTLASALIGASGEWGLDLGRRLLAGATVPMDVKLGAAQALVEAGVFAPNEPIPIVHQGRPTTMVVQSMPVVDESPEAEAVVERARRLRDAGKHDEALRLLADLSLKGIAYPPAMMMQANLMRSAGELDGARSILESLEKLAPEDPGVLFNLAGLWLQYGNRERARSYADRIQVAGTSAEFQRMLAGLKAELRKLDIITELPSVNDIADGMREELEERSLYLDATLTACLKQIPVDWLNAAVAAHGLPPAKRRPEREKALAASLKAPGRVAALLGGEGPEVAACLRFLLEAGGWSKLPAVTKRFGPVDADGFFWAEQPPVSPLGRLRLLGLVFVGRAVIDGRRYKVALVPADLRSILATEV